MYLPLNSKESTDFTRPELELQESSVHSEETVVR